MPAIHQRDSLQKPRVLLFFIEFNILILLKICRQKRTHLNPGPSLSLHPAPSPQPQPPPRRKRMSSDSRVMPWILQREERRCNRTLQVDLIQTVSQATTILLGCHLPFMTSLKNTYTAAPRSQSQIPESP